MRNLHERLREERSNLGLTQVQLAELGGVKKQAQSMYETGKRVPDAVYLQAISDAGVDITYVLTGNRVPKQVKQLQQQLEPITSSDAYKVTQAIQEQYGDVLKVANNAEQLAAEFYANNPDAVAPESEFDLDGQRFAAIGRYDASSAAGDGVINFDGPPIDHLAFSKTWLAQNGINAGACVLINVKGDSMEPSIYDGDLVMIDRRRQTIRTGHLYVFRDGDEELRLKRLDVIPDTAITLRSDNPKYPPEPRTGEAMNAISEGIVGEVVWSGHKWV